MQSAWDKNPPPIPLMKKPNEWDLDEVVLINRELELSDLFKKIKANKRQQKIWVKRFNELKDQSHVHRDNPEESD